MRRVYLTAFFCFLCFICLAQGASPFSFTHYSAKDGLVSNEINSIVQDRTGYLWIATNRGLQRFDGVQYKTFRYQEGNTASLAENVVVQVMIDKEDNLWVLTAKGHLGIFNRSSFTFHPVAVKPRSPANYYLEKRLITDEYNNIFLLYRGNELIQYDKKKNEFSSTANIIPLKPEWSITSMSQQPGTQKYWVGLQNGGIVIYNRKTGNLNYTNHNIDKEPAIELFGPAISFTHSFFDNQGRLWFERWGPGFPYCMQYDARKKEKPLQAFEFMTTLKTYNELHGFMQQRDGRIWVKGLQIFGFFNEAKNKFQLIANDFKAEQGIVYQTATYLYEDRENNVWVGTRSNGLYRLNPSQQYFTNIAHNHPVTGLKGDGSLMSFIETNKGGIIASAWGDGLCRYDKNFNLLPLNIKGFREAGITSIWDMHLSKDKDVIWMASQPGIFKYSQSKGSGIFYNPSILQNRTVRQIIEDSMGKLWLGMQGFGLFQWNPSRAVRSFDEGITNITSVPANAMINQLIIDKWGWLWVATGNNGVYALDPVTGKQILHFDSHINSGHKVIGDGVTGVLPYNDSLIAISIPTAIYLYNRFTFKLRPLIEAETLSGGITAMAKDFSGYIWVSTSNALYRISLFSGTKIQFDRMDGITNDRFVLASVYTLSDGRMLFGNTNEFIAFRPSEIDINNRAPDVAITDFKVMDKSLSVDSILSLKRLVLPHLDNSINVNFSSLYYSSVYPVKYKLEGLDKEWRLSDRTMNAIYSYLPPGVYTLVLQAVDAEGESTGAETRLPIFVKAPFWLTWWFYTLLGIALASFLYWFDRQRMKRKEGLERVRTDIANGLHQEVNTALNNINILSEIARLKSEKEPQKAKEYLEQIHTKSHNMIIALDDMLWSLAPENDAMDKTINRIKEFADSLTQRHGVAIELLIDKKVEGLELDMKMRHEAFLLFKEGLRSLVEAGTQLCIVHVTLEKGKLLFTIEFENEGCDMQQLNNLLHRRDMEARLHALKAKLDVQVHKSRSMFLLQLPLS